MQYVAGICVGPEASLLVLQFTYVKHSNLIKQKTKKMTMYRINNKDKYQKRQIKNTRTPEQHEMYLNSADK